MSSYPNAASGNPVAPLLEQVFSVLSGDVDLTTLVDPSSIGLNQRKSLQYPAVEFGIENALSSTAYRDNTRISVMVYSTTSAEDAAVIADRIKFLLRPSTLTCPDKGVFVARVKCVRHILLPRDDYGADVSMTFLTRYAYKKE